MVYAFSMSHDASKPLTRYVEAIFDSCRKWSKREIGQMTQISRWHLSVVLVTNALRSDERQRILNTG
jgi:hypothetical protein